MGQKNVRCDGHALSDSVSVRHLTRDRLASPSLPAPHTLQALLREAEEEDKETEEGEDSDSIPVSVVATVLALQDQAQEGQQEERSLVQSNLPAFISNGLVFGYWTRCPLG